MSKLSKYIIDSIITKSLLFFFPDPYYDHTEIIEFLMESKDFDNIFDLFTHEKREAENIENSRNEDEEVKD